MFTISFSHLQQNAFLKQHFLKINSKNNYCQILQIRLLNRMSLIFDE